MKTLKGTQLFSVGQWNGLSFTEKDLDSIVNSFLALSLEGRVPLKLSHEGPDPREDLETKYALGWVRKIWRDGDILKGDLEVPDKVAHALGEGYLKFVSVELLKNVKADTRVLPWVLDAVALLGADQPAVGILKDLQALMSRRPVTAQLQCESRTAFRRDDSTQSEKHGMTPEEITAMQAENARLKLANETQKAEFERKEQTRIETEATRRLTAAKALFAKAVTDDAILPAVGERFFKFSAPKATDHAAWAEFDLTVAEACIAENPKPGAKKFHKQNAKQGGKQDGEATMDDAELEGLDPSQVIAKIAMSRLRAEKRDANDPAEFDAMVRQVMKERSEGTKHYVDFVRTGETPAPAK